MAQRAERLAKLHRLLGQLREAEETRQARLDAAAKAIDDRRRDLAATMSRPEDFGFGLLQSFALQYVRKARELAAAEQSAERQRSKLLAVARREASAERIAAAAVADERSAAESEDLADILERTAAKVSSTRLP